MCTAGRIKFHLANNLYRAESCVVFVGYQAEGTLGRRLVERGEARGASTGRTSRCGRRSTRSGVLAHADRDHLARVDVVNTKRRMRVFVVHGEESASNAFAASVRERFGCQTTAPRWGEIVDLDTMEVARRTTAPRPPRPWNAKWRRSETMAALFAKYERAKKEKRIFQARRLEQT
jgi:metallo-beta-lactamase family protein